MSRARQVRRIGPPTLYNLLQLELEVHLGIEYRNGRNLVYVDESLLTEKIFDISVTIRDNDNIVHARYVTLCFLAGVERYNHLKLLNILLQLDVIDDREYLWFINKINTHSPIAWL